MAVDKLVDSSQLDNGLTSVANAIRTRGGTQASLAFPSGFVSAISSIPNVYAVSDEGKVVSGGALVSQTPTSVTQNGTVDTTLINSVEVNVSGGGGSSVASNDVNFYDYDGTIVASYSAADFANLSAMPDNPSHEGLTAQGWNWTLANAKTYAASYGKLNIGQMYITSDGKTRIHIKLEDGRLAPYLGICVSGTCDVDWGDGTAHSTLTGTSISTNVYVQHTYASPGKYTITLDCGEGAIGFQYSSTSRLLSFKGSSNDNRDYAYRSAIMSINIGAGVTSIGDYAFSNCFSLMSVTIPSTVTSIGNYAFSYCYSLMSVTIPSSVTSIGNYAFYYFYSSGFIKFNSSTPPTVSGTYAFTSTPADCILYVPFSALSAYLSASNYPNKSTYTYIGFATYESAVALPTQDSTQAYNVVWYATEDDAIDQTNPITVGNGKEIYCRYTAV